MLIRWGSLATLLVALTGSCLSAGPAAAGGGARLQPAATHARLTGTGTMILRGSLRSTAVLTMSGAFSVGHATNLDWDLPLIHSTKVGGYRERVLSEQFEFSVPPDSFQDLPDMSVRRFHWNTPPANTVITAVIRLHVRVRSRLVRLHPLTRYPLASIPASVAPSMAETPLLRLSGSRHSFVRRFAHTSRERTVVLHVLNWVASHTHYDAALQGSSQSAQLTLQRHAATCSGYVNLTAGILRRLGIPSQVVYGWVSTKPILLRAHHRLVRGIQWGRAGSQGGLHVWLNVYFPGRGWIAVDPQMEKFFVDPRHFAFTTGVDARDLQVGHWSAYGVGQQAPTGSLLANGSVEIVPGEGTGTSVTIHDTDHFHLTIPRMVGDVHRVLLLSR